MYKPWVGAQSSVWGGPNASDNHVVNLWKVFTSCLVKDTPGKLYCEVALLHQALASHISHLSTDSNDGYVGNSETSFVSEEAFPDAQNDLLLLDIDSAQALVADCTGDNMDMTNVE